MNEFFSEYKIKVAKTRNDSGQRFQAYRVYDNGGNLITVSATIDCLAYQMGLSNEDTMYLRLKYGK